MAGLSTRAIYRAIERDELSAARLCSRLRIPRRRSTTGSSAAPCGLLRAWSVPAATSTGRAWSFRALLPRRPEDGTG